MLKEETGLEEIVSALVEGALSQYQGFGSRSVVGSLRAHPVMLGRVGVTSGEESPLVVIRGRHLTAVPDQALEVDVVVLDVAGTVVEVVMVPAGLEAHVAQEYLQLRGEGLGVEAVEAVLE